MSRGQQEALGDEGSSADVGPDRLVQLRVGDPLSEARGPRKHLDRLDTSADVCGIVGQAAVRVLNLS